MDTEVLQAIGNATGDGIVVADEHGNIVFENAAAKRLLDVVEAAVAASDSDQSLLARAVGGESFDLAEVFVRSDGLPEGPWVSVSAGPLRDEKGGFVIIRDVSDRKRAEEALKRESRLGQTQKMEAMATLAGVIAHDFNNLLTVIAGYNHMALDELPPDDPARSATEEVAKAAQRAAALTNQLLTFSRRQVTQPKVIDLSKVVLDSQDTLRRLIGESMQLVPVLAPDLHKIKADPASLEQIIVNLVANSRDAMREGGRVIVETGNAGADQIDAVGVGPEADSYVMLTVSDNGCGMDLDTQSRIFEPFFTTKERGQGTGLGLATVYAMVSQSGGHIVVDSQPGEGTTVKIYFPAMEETGEEAGAPHARQGTETILLVEDDTGVRKLVQMTLEQRGYTVLEASNGWEALQLQEQHQGPIHLLIADIVVPQMNGQELAARLGLLRPDTRVLYMSGYTDKSIILEGVLSSGTAFIKKPFTPDALVAKVREVLDSQKSKRAG